MAYAGPKNKTGPEGPKGEPGKNGINGKTPAFDIGEVKSGSKAKVWLTGDALNIILNFIIPKGDKGEKGEQGRHGAPGFIEESAGGGSSFDANTILTGPTDCLYFGSIAPLSVLIDNKGNVLTSLQE